MKIMQDIHPITNHFCFWYVSIITGSGGALKNLFIVLSIN